MHIVSKRVYEDPSKEDGIRVLVDKLWPRGMSKQKAQADHWWKDIAPSDDLRKWFDHDDNKWNSFKKKYRQELQDNEEKIKEYLDKVDQRKKITLLFATKDKKRNNAVVLREYLQQRCI